MTITVNYGMLDTIVDDASEGWDNSNITYSLDVDPGNLFSDFLEELPFQFDPDITNTAATELLVFNEIAELWDDLIASTITFRSSDDDADIIINKVSNLPASSAGITVSTLHVPLIPDDADVFLANVAITAGMSAWRTAVHEFGHALGLQHPGDYNAGDEQPQYGTDNEFDVDTAQFSIMSYFNASNFGPGWTTANSWARATVLTPMIYDILAIQQYYGIDTTTRTGDTTYGFGSTADRSVYLFIAAQKPVLTIWDAGGAHDVLNVSGFNGSPTQLIDLNEGSYSDIAGLHNNLGIAFGTVIEDAVGGTGIDVILGNSSANRLDGGSGNGADDIQGGAGDDILIGGNGADRLLGGADDDDIIGGNGGDVISGGQGFDRAFYTAATGETVILTPGGSPSLGRWTVAGSAESTGDTLFGIEAFVFGEGGDIISLGASNGIYEVTIDGRGGNDRLNGSTDSFDTDTLIGGLGTDIITPGRGKFFVFGGAAGADEDTWTESLTQNDQLVIDNTGFAGTYDFTRIGTNTPLGDYLTSDGSTVRGISRLDYTGSNLRDFVMGMRGTDVLRGNGGIDTLSGLDGDDILSGGGGDDFLSGDAGADTLRDGAGSDFLDGGSSRDVFVLTADNTQDEVDGGTGNDTLDLSQALGKITIAFGSTAATLFDGKITGGQMTAIPGADTFTSVEVFIASDFSDTFRGGKQANTCFGGNGNDVLFGNGGADTLSGQDGRDRIVGGTGIDRCSGGADVDRFVFQTAAEGGDIIVDFATGEDIIEIDRSGFGLTARYDLVFQQAASASGSRPVFLYNAATDELSFDANGAGAGGRTLLAHFATGVVAAGDILLV
ncbi:M10 family metallopeptidase C-terminal domain-containing protein [Aestuariivirga sp.]|uniref:M10 family metallopeptidase C-terminal domain-containing protein n=1 Tax=Aestuariivirga sp. TaxID=2650926 RepID=UPI003593A01F